MSIGTPALGPDFVGRDLLLSALSAWARSTDAPILVVTGQRRIGKTSLVRTHAALSRSVYTHQLVLYPYDFDSPDSLLKYVEGWLAESNLGYPLVVLDDFEVDRWDERDQMTLVERLWTRIPHGHLLLTSHILHDWHARLSSLRIVTVGPFSLREAHDLIKRRVTDDGEADRLLEFAHTRFSSASPFAILALTEFFLRERTLTGFDEWLSEHFHETISPISLLIRESGDRLLVEPVNALGTFDLLTPNSRLFLTSPYVILPRVQGYWTKEIATLEEYINDPTTPEAVFQEFFTRNDRLLAGIDYKRVVAHPVLSRRDDEAEGRTHRGPLIPDFMLVPRAERFADVLDLKRPNVDLIVGGRDRRRYSSSVTDALAQVREYRAYFDDPAHRDYFKKKYGFESYQPNVAIVIGRDPEPLDALQVRRVEGDLPRGVRITTYDALLSRVRALVNGFSS